MPDYKCSKCGSDNIQSVPIAYKSGLRDYSGNLIQSSSGKVNIDSMGLAITKNGLAPVFGVGGGKVETKNNNKIDLHSQSALSAMMAPPSKNYTLQVGLFLLPAAILSLFLYSKFYAIGSVISIIIAVFFLLWTSLSLIKIIILKYLKFNMEYLYMELSLILTLFLLLKTSFNFNTFIFFSWILVIISALYASIKRIKFLKQRNMEYHKEIEAWNKQYICYRCGNIFELSDN